MIKGAPFWNDRSRYYIQTNNAIEETLTDYFARDNSVACGPTAAVNCVASMGRQVNVVTPNGWQPQPEDVLMLWFHDSGNYKSMDRIRPETSPSKTMYPPNEIPQYYPEAVKQVFGIRARFEWLSDFGKVAMLVSGGSPVMVAKKKPGHFISLVAFDDTYSEFIYHDSYPPFHTDGNGFACRLTQDEWNSNIKPFAVVFG